MYLDLFRSMSSDDQQTSDFTKMLQTVYELGLGQYLTDTQKPTTSDSNQPPKTTTDTNDIVLLDSDDDKAE